jgi:hypothetical protein
MHRSQGDFSPALLHAGIPTLRVRGLQSDVVSDAGVTRLQDWIPRLEIVNVVPRAGIEPAT